MKYDYLVVGAGLFGAVFGQQAKEKGYSVLVVDKRDHMKNFGIISGKKIPAFIINWPTKAYPYS